MSWQERRRPKRSHPWPPPQGYDLESFNDFLKDLDRNGQLDAYMAAWLLHEKERSAVV